MSKIQDVAVIGLAALMVGTYGVAAAEGIEEVAPVEKAAEEIVEVARDVDVKAAEKTGEALVEKAAAKADAAKSVKISVQGSAQVGKMIKLKATIKGYEDEPYKIIWQTSSDNGETWKTLKGNKKSLKVEVTKENKDDLWRVAIETPD